MKRRIGANLAVCAMTALGAGPSAAVDAEAPAVRGSPAVQAAEQTRAPHELRRSRAAVPQVVVPLRHERRELAQRPPAGAMDGVARCVAIDSRAARRACFNRLEREHVG